MYCGKCGTQNVDGAVFCASCGARMNEIQPEGTTINEMDLNARNRKVGIIAVVAVGIVAVIAAFLIFGGSSYKKTVDQLMDAFEKSDAEAILDLIPEEVIYYEYDSRIDALEELEDAFYYFEEYLEAVQISHEILAAQDITGMELYDIKDEYAEYGVKVKESKDIDLLIIVETVDGRVERDTTNLTLIKVDNSWYISSI